MIFKVDLSKIATSLILVTIEAMCNVDHSMVLQEEKQGKRKGKNSFKTHCLDKHTKQGSFIKILNIVL